MGRAAVISVGDELLAGRTTDTNVVLLSRELLGAGFPVIHRETVPDVADAVAAAIQRCASEADVVVVSGGLGPTPDDLTREGLARAVGRPCVRDPEAEGMIRELFARFGREVTETNLIQADLPEGTVPLKNDGGSAPGIRAELTGASVFVFPGVPREFEAMTRAHLLPALADHEARGAAPCQGAVTVCGVPESRVAELLEDLMQRGRNPTVGSYPRVAHLVLSVEAVDGASDSAEDLVRRDIDEIRARLGDAVVGEGSLEVHEVVAEALIRAGLTLAVAESLTAGRIADLIVSVPGVSAVFRAGFATYSNDAKRDVLGVREETLADHGAVSEACVREMAEGARQVSGADLALATTGIAGPTGAVPGKPVGTVFIALSTSAATEVKRLRLIGDRYQIRERATVAALDLLRRHLG